MTPTTSLHHLSDAQMQESLSLLYACMQLAYMFILPAMIVAVITLIISWSLWRAWHDYSQLGGGVDDDRQED